MSDQPRSPLSSLSLPLLPYEKHLIDLLGCSAEEYKQFRKEVILQSRVRPAGYESVPDIQNDATAWAIAAIVISVGAQVASYLLAPKPQAPEKPGRNRQLDSIVGRDSFAPTFGFQAGQDISRFGEPIPIVFTKHFYQGFLRQYIGGVMISPKLVWSRSFSWGTFQSVDMVFLAGQGRMGRGPYTTPQDIAEDRAGIYIGQSPLDALSPSDYRWFYYQGAEPKSNGIGYENDSRLTFAHYRHGDWGNDGPPDTAFYAPTFAGTQAAGFSHSFSPSTQLQFGVYNAIPNGTPLRLNWQVISAPDNAGDEANRSSKARRVLICGNANMEGVGRNYPRQIGIVEYNGVRTTASGNNGEYKDGVKEGDTIKIVFNGEKLQKKYFEEAYLNKKDLSWRGIDHTEIITSNEAELEKYDEILQIGTYFLIGNCKFIVESRTPNNVFYDRGDTQAVTVVLRCKEVYPDTFGSGRIGICNPDYVNRTTPLPRPTKDTSIDIGAPWFPICQAEMATFQNTRRCQYTEIGIKSNVWLRFNGLCNFTNLPSAALLDSYDDDNVTVSSGTLQTYGRRASFFYLYARPADAGTSQKWARITLSPFCVAGSSAQDQFNFIRVNHNFDQFEFMLRPLSSAELVHIIGTDKQCLRLGATASFIAPETYFTPYGRFTVYTKGVKENISELVLNYELVNNLTGKDAAFYKKSNLEIQFERATLKDGRTASPQQISNAISKAINKDADDNATEDGFADIPWSGVREGGIYTFTDTEANIFRASQTKNGRTRAMSLRMKLQVYKGAVVGTPSRDLFWRIGEIAPVDVVVDPKYSWEDGDIFTITKELINPIDSVTYHFRVIAGNNAAVPALVRPAADRIFEGNSAIAEVSHYGDLITRSCDNGPEHEVVYVNESLTPSVIPTYEGCAMAGLRIRSGRNFNQLEQLHLYQKNGIQVELVREGRRPYAVGSSNIFTDLVYYLATNKQAGLGALVGDSMVDNESFEQTAKFLDSNYLYYDDVLVEPQNLREFVSSIAPSLICNVSTRNGKLAITPAVPAQRTGSILPLVDVPIRAMFTDGNIIEDSFELRYISADERKPFKAAIRYREERPNQFPQEKSILVYYGDQADAPIEQFNFTHITSRVHAEQAARYFLSTRRHVTHTISFKAVPYGMVLAPGDYIRVNTKENNFDPLNNSGIILNDADANNALLNFNGGTIVSSEPIPNGDVDIYLWDRTNSNVVETTMTVRDGMAFNQRNAMFALRNDTTRSEVYVVESLQLDEDGMVAITASYFPLITGTNQSLIASDVTGGNQFVVEVN